MDIRIEGRSPKAPQAWPMLGVEGDAGVETVRFTLPRYTANGVDLSTGLAYVGYQLMDGSTQAVAILEDEKEVSENSVILNWLVGGQATAQPGHIKAALKISGLDGELWHSEAMIFTVAATIPIESPQPMIYRSRSLSIGPMLRTAVPDTEPPITVSERTLNIPTELQNIAVQNDQNSETVKLVCPRYFDGHDLSVYSFFLRTVSQEGYDAVALTPQASESELSMFWTLKPPQTSYNGKLSIQLWVTGQDFDWQTAEASVNIIRQIGGEPVIPTTPSVLDEFLKQISAIGNAAHTSEINAKASESAAATSAAQAKGSETSAASSAANARDSELNAKKSETAAGDSLTDINAGLVSKLPISDANSLIKSVSFDGDTGIFVFTRYDGTTISIDTPVERVTVNMYVDTATNELVFVFEDGSEQRISLAAFMNIYTGGTTGTVEVKVDGTVIKADIKGASVGLNLLTQQLQDTITGKVTANEAGNAGQIKFTDGKTMQQKLDSGDLNGKDGLSVATNGMFYVRVDSAGNLIVGVADGAAPPPLSIRDGYLIYTL